MTKRYGIGGLVVVCFTLVLSGCGSGNHLAGGQEPSTSAPASSGGIAPSVSGSGAGTVLSNLQTRAGNWQSFGQAYPNYVDCSAPCSESTWEEIYGVADPSLSGDATMFDLDPSIPYADALFTAGVIGANSPQIPDRDHSLLPTLHNFIYETDFYVTEPQVTQALEFDISVWMSGVAGMTFGSQCNHLGDGDWDVWNNSTRHWVSAGVPCQLVQGWNHYTLQVQRQADNSVFYQSIALNGTTYAVNQASPSIATPAGWWGVNLNFQMDSDHLGSPNTAYLDNLTFTYW